MSQSGCAALLLIIVARGTRRLIYHNFFPECSFEEQSDVPECFLSLHLAKINEVVIITSKKAKL